MWGVLSSLTEDLRSAVAEDLSANEYKRDDDEERDENDKESRNEEINEYLVMLVDILQI